MWDKKGKFCTCYYLFYWLNSRTVPGKRRNWKGIIRRIPMEFQFHDRIRNSYSRRWLLLLVVVVLLVATIIKQKFPCSHSLLTTNSKLWWATNSHESNISHEMPINHSRVLKAGISITPRHLGEWRDLTKRKHACVTNGFQSDGVPCNHGFLHSHGSHWSCCGALQFDSPPCKALEKENSYQKLDHTFYTSDCRICTKCFKCSKFGSTCIRVSRHDRSSDAGKPCGCGAGESGCVNCGMCKRCCASQKQCIPRNDQSVNAIPVPSASLTSAPKSYSVNSRVTCQWRRPGGTSYSGRISHVSHSPHKCCRTQMLFFSPVVFIRSRYVLARISPRIQVNSDGTYEVQYDDGDHDSRVSSPRITSIAQRSTPVSRTSPRDILSALLPQGATLYSTLSDTWFDNLIKCYWVLTRMQSIPSVQARLQWYSRGPPPRAPVLALVMQQRQAGLDPLRIVVLDSPVDCLRGWEASQSLGRVYSRGWAR